MIRKADKNDLADIFMIFSETKTPWSEDGINKSIEKGEFFVWDDMGIVATIALSRVLDEAEILNFAVKKEIRRQGIGYKFMSQIITSLKNEGIKNVFLDVRESNEAAYNLYKKIGFEDIGTRKQFYQNPCEDALLMALYI